MMSKWFLRSGKNPHIRTYNFEMNLIVVVNNVKHCLLENVTTNERPNISFLSMSNINNSHQ